MTVDPLNFNNHIEISKDWLFISFSIDWLPVYDWDKLVREYFDRVLYHINNNKNENKSSQDQEAKKKD